MQSSNDVYTQLRSHLDTMPVAFPQSESGIEIDILKRFFTEDEARIALNLSMLPEPARRIHRRAQRRDHHIDLSTTEKLLHNLVKKKAVHSTLARKRGKIVRLYGKLPFAVGLYEFQVDRLTRDFEYEASAYMDEAFMEDFIQEKPRQMRTIPINETILPDRAVSQYDNIRHVIENSTGPFALQNCVCRQGRELIGEQCRQTEMKQTCLALESAASQVIAENRGTKLTKQETLDFLRQAEKEGLVLQAQNTQHPVFICSCCSCCCAILSRAKKLPNPGSFLHSNYIAKIDHTRCIGCTLCLPRCPMDAISMADISNSKSTEASAGGKAKPQIAAVEPDRCIGCGLCVSACTSHAICMQRRGEVETPPKSAMGMYVKMLYGRFGFVKATALLLKAGIGLKV